MRIAKALARAGLCSRRDGERWIAEGRVKVNGRLIESPALDVTPKDRILVDGEPLPAAEPARLWRYYKPKGLVTSHKDPEGRDTVFDNLPAELPRVVSVGRLDYNTEGLLLLTTDGALARHLELPATGWLRRYRVRAHGRVTQSNLDGLKEGISIDGIHYGPIEATLDTVMGGNVWLTIGIREGKNREVRRVLESLSLEVNRLIRISFGPFQLFDMKPETAELVRRRVLIEQLGKTVAEDLGLTGEDDSEVALSKPWRVAKSKIEAAKTRGKTAPSTKKDKPVEKAAPAHKPARKREKRVPLQLADGPAGRQASDKQQRKTLKLKKSKRAGVKVARRRALLVKSAPKRSRS